MQILIVICPLLAILVWHLTWKREFDRRCKETADRITARAERGWAEQQILAKRIRDEKL